MKNTLVEMKNEFMNYMERTSMEIKLRGKLRKEKFDSDKKELIIMIDIDEILFNDIVLLKINEESKNWINFLYDFGFYMRFITNFPFEDSEIIENFLEENEVYYDEILYEKPQSLVYITKDENLKFNSWKQILSNILEKIKI